jgi:hypothetical protein
MTNLVPQENKPEHRAIRLILAETDVPDFRLSLPAKVTVTVEGQSLIIQVDGSDQCIELAAPEIPRIITGGWCKEFHTATVPIDPLPISVPELMRESVRV